MKMIFFVFLRGSQSNICGTRSGKQFTNWKCVSKAFNCSARKFESVKSIALYHDTVLCLMVDGADSKKKNALFSEKLQSVTTEIQTFININFEFEFQSL